MFFRTVGICALVTFGVTAASSDAAARDYSYTRIKVNPRNGSYSVALNNKGMVLGYYGVDEMNDEGLFTWQAGQVTKYKIPGAKEYRPGNLNDSGDFVGSYRDRSGTVHGFIHSFGKFTTLDYPGAIATNLIAINNAGVIVGAYQKDKQSGITIGFEYANGAFNTEMLTVKDGTLVPYAINQRGDIVADRPRGAMHDKTLSYLLKADSRQISINLNTSDEVYALNNRSEVIGTNGLVYKDRTSERIENPLCDAVVSLVSINDRGDILGKCDSAEDPNFGFVYHAGEFKTLKPFRGKMLVLAAINDSGQILEGNVLATPK